MIHVIVSAYFGLHNGLISIESTLIAKAMEEGKHLSTTTVFLDFVRQSYHVIRTYDITGLQDCHNDKKQKIRHI